MEEVEAADPWRDVVYLSRFEDDDPVSNFTSENGHEEYSEEVDGNECSQNLDYQGEDADLAIEAEVESTLSAAPDLPDGADFAAIENALEDEPDHETASTTSRRLPIAATPKKGNSASKLTEATLNSLRRSASAAARTQAPPSPKPFLRSTSSMAAARRSQVNTDGATGGTASGNGVRKLGPPIISAAPVIRSRGIPRETSSSTSIMRSSTNTLRGSAPPVRSSTNSLSSRTNTLRSSTNSLNATARSTTSVVRSSAGSGAISGLRKPSQTTDPRRSSLTTLPTRSAGASRRNSLSGVASLSRSVDLPSASDLKQWASSAPALKASGRRVNSSAATSTQATASYPKRVSSSVSDHKSPNESRKPFSKTSPSPVKSRSSATSSTPVVSRSSSVSSSPNYKSPPVTANGVSNRDTNRDAVKKKLSPSPSLGAGRTSSFAEPVGKPSPSSSSERSLNTSSNTTKSSPSERRLSLSTPKQYPADKNASSQSRGVTKSSPSERTSSTAKIVKSSPGSAASPTERPGSLRGAKLSPSASGNVSTGSKDKSASQASSKYSPSAVTADRGPSMLTRKKTLTSDTRDAKIVALPSVEVKAGEDVRLDLRGQKVRTLDGNLVSLTPKMEFVYFRDNKLATLNGIEILRRVKVLDLSFNEFKGAGLEPLASCKALQQLYLAGNQITSLSDLPQLPNLEFLSVAQNKIKSLCMASQPRLQVLAASKNKISTFKDFPHLPALEHLRLEENPILESFHVEAQSILLVGPSLKKFNDRDLSTQELEFARMYPPSTALCIREGWEDRKSVV